MTPDPPKTPTIASHAIRRDTRGRDDPGPQPSPARAHHGRLPATGRDRQPRNRTDPPPHRRAERQGKTIAPQATPFDAPPGLRPAGVLPPSRTAVPRLI